LEGIWKENIVEFKEVLTGHFLGRPEKYQEKTCQDSR
jgi:hypothetical protein